MTAAASPLGVDPSVADRADLRFWFDPVCPFAWLASRWVQLVAAHRDYQVEWRFISLALLNEKADPADMPQDRLDGMHAGLRLLRVAAAVRAELGNEAVGRFYTACGAATFDVADRADALPSRVTRDGAAAISALLADAGLPAALAGAADDADRDTQIRAETEEALGLAGRDVGTPIIQVGPPDGMAFFGPVISVVPDPASAVQLWDHVTGLASFDGFAELKRSLRQMPVLRAFDATAPASATSAS